MPSPSKYLLTERQDRVLTVRLSNPPLNFLSSAMIRELDQLLRQLEDDHDIGAVILTGAVPNVFLTHFDVDEIKAAARAAVAPVSPGVGKLAMRAEASLHHLPGARRLVEKTPAAGLAQMNLFHEVTARMRRLDKVLIAAINGRAMGGGCELALACDLRLMCEGSVEQGQVIGQPEIYLGLIPGGGGTQMLVRNLGVARALELCLEGRLLSPSEARELGLVNRVVATDRLMAEALEVAQRMARRPSHAIRAIKHLVYQSASQTFDQGMASEKAEFLSAATQASTRRATLAYAEQVARIVQSGRDISPADFADWAEGTAITFSR